MLVYKLSSLCLAGLRVVIKVGRRQYGPLCVFVTYSELFVLLLLTGMFHLRHSVLIQLLTRHCQSVPNIGKATVNVTLEMILRDMHVATY
jgi:hypothetical protein